MREGQEAAILHTCTHLHLLLCNHFQFRPPRPTIQPLKHTYRKLLRARSFSNNDSSTTGAAPVKLGLVLTTVTRSLSKSMFASVQVF